ncbi:MAG: hypothetical protein JNJ88_12290 [Planctomycetes bacterium]|nr:hypothetical protein [Planctomycetota bacterium]
MALGDSFDHFRRNRHAAKLEDCLRQRVASTRNELVKHIAAMEAAEEVEKRVTEQMRDFFRDSTRLAAQVLSAIHQRRAQEIEGRLEKEIQGFFESTRVEALRAIQEIRTGAPSAQAQLDSLFEVQVRRIADAAARS